MAASDEVVDISENAGSIRKRRRRAILRIGVPIFAISMVIAAILGITVYSHYANRQGILVLSDDLLNTLDAQIAQRVVAYLDPCERTLRIMRDAAAKIPLPERFAMTERFAASVLHELPQISSFYDGDGAGNFLMVRRAEGGGVETKQIVSEAAGRRVTLIDRDAAGEEKSRREDPGDPFDPRTRPWYQGALKTDDVFWTGIYIFFSDQKPGITVSVRSRAPADAERVFGVDIRLEELSRFLDTLKIGDSGRALIMDGEGRLIAAPEEMSAVKSVGSDLVQTRVDELGDPVLTAAFDRFRIEGRGQRIIDRDGVRYISSATPLPGAARDWWVLIVVPENDFIGFVTSNSRTALKMSLVIVFAVAVLAFLFAKQGFRMDRMTRLMTDRRKSIAEQSAAYAAISEQISAAPTEMPPALTESLAMVTGALRASVWGLAMRGQALRCIDSYDRTTQGHVSGFELHRRELPNFFELLESGEETSVVDAAADRRTAQFHEVIMHPLGSRSLILVPLRRQGRVAGTICLEESGGVSRASDFIRTVSAMLLPFLKASEAELDHQEETRPIPYASLSSAGMKTGQEFLPTDIRLSAAELAALGSDQFTGIAVMVLRLSGSFALAKKTADSEVGAATQIAAMLGATAADYAISYLKFVGQQVVAAAGMSADDDDAMARMGAFAIAVREQLSHFSNASGRDLEFHIGLAFGECFGCDIGQDVQQFNLWGDAIQIADIMATSAGAGAIQASEAAYARLRENFLFRPRGSFYVPGIAESRTFVLAGQL